MSKTRTKVTYECDEMCEMGGCGGKRNVLLLMENASCDIFSIVSVKHADDEKPKISYDMFGGDNMFSALCDLVNGNEEKITGWDKEDFEFYEFAVTPVAFQVWPPKKNIDK